MYNIINHNVVRCYKGWQREKGRKGNLQLFFQIAIHSIGNKKKRIAICGSSNQKYCF